MPSLAGSRALSAPVYPLGAVFFEYQLNLCCIAGMDGFQKKALKIFYQAKLLNLIL